jgi:hypothetical protein
MGIISGGTAALPGELVYEEVTFTETSGSGVYTGSVTVPGRSWLLDIKIYPVALWDNTGTAVMKVGDVTTSDGWFTGIDLKATDLIAGTNAEVIDFQNTGGKEGGYLVVLSGERAVMYSATARVVSGVVTTSSTGGTAGRTRMVVIYSTVDSPTAATYVAT